MKLQPTKPKKPTFLQEHEKEVVELFNPNGKAPIVLICEHASKFIPESLKGLGLSDEGLESHAAWDIGAYDLACKLSELIDAPLVAARVSRLVYDCNRSPESRAGTPTKSEHFDVPGNQNLSDTDYQLRVKEVYEPFHEMISNVVSTKSISTKRSSLSSSSNSNSAQNNISLKPILITIHSFTPVYFGESRTVELGILHDTDERLAKPLMQAALESAQFKVEFNSPYGISDNVMHTVNKHAAEQKLLNVMIEVKNDLLSNPKDINVMAKDLSEMIIKAVFSIGVPHSETSNQEAGENNDG